MPEGWRHDYANWVLGGGNIFLLAIGFHQQSLFGWNLALGLVGVTSFLAWYANLKRYRIVADTPTARIVSAPQGYIEIAGRGKQPPGEPLHSPMTGLPCLWYRYHVECKEDDRWETVDSRVSHDTFGIDDGTAMMLVDPDDAEILTSRKQVSNRGDCRHTEWTLIAGETLYAIGEHVTLGGAHAQLESVADIGAMLAEWKKDRPALLARFDRNRDGEIDMDEWEDARRAAAAEVAQSHVELRQQDGVHLMRKPADRRPFLIANRKVEAVIRHYKMWSAIHLMLLAGALGGIVFLASAPGIL